MAVIQFDGALAGLGGTREKPDFYLDGDYSKAFPAGLPVPTYPFLNQGDTETVVLRQPHEQSLTAYKPLDLKKGMPGVGNAYPLGDTNFRDVGGGVVTFDRLFANIPKQRVRRGQSHRYSFQYVLNSGARITGLIRPIVGFEGSNYTLGALPWTVDSTLIYDYFLAGDESQFPLSRAPVLFQVGQTIQTRGQSIGGDGFPLYLDGACVCSDVPILAEEDAYDDWQGAIRCRVRRIIEGPTPAFWRNELNQG